jgi:kynurenine formamidase
MEEEGRARWSRFGPSDRKGALNFIDAEKVIGAAALISIGKVIALNLPLHEPEPSPVGRPKLQRTTRQHNFLRSAGDGVFAVVNDDVVEFALQGSSHWDAFAHCGAIYGASPEVFYGGRGIDETDAQTGAHGLGIEAFAGGVVTRGVLLDVVALCGGGELFLPDDFIITRDVIELCLDSQELTLERGDAVLIYTGFMRRLARNDLGHPNQVAGIDGSSLGIWNEREVAALISDNTAVEAWPVDFSIHIGALRNLGIPLGELWALDELAQYCREAARYEFFLTSAPLNLEGAYGSPANALAIF